MSNPLQVLAGIAIVFFLPGFTMVCMMFPRKGELDPEYDIVYRLALGMGVSVVISIIVGFALNAISTEEHAYVKAGPLWASLLSVTGIFTFVGWWRGAYPSAGRIHPMFYRAPAVPGAPRRKGSDYQRHKSTEKLLVEREQLLKDLKTFAGRSSTSSPQRKLYYTKRMEQARDRINHINNELRSQSPGDS